MDQVNKLYEELVAYDPSLGKNKEAVLQVIEKMVAAKPVISIRKEWQEMFGDKLACHIADAKFIPAKASPFAKFAKRSYSLASLAVALMVVGGSYYWYTSNHINMQKSQKSSMKIDSQVVSDMQTGENLATGDDALDEDTALVNTTLEASDQATYENSTLLRNSQTINALQKNAELPKINTNAKILTQVDTSKSENLVGVQVAVNSSIGGTSGGATSQGYDASATAITMMKVPEAADQNSRAMDTMTATVTNEVALVFIDNKGDLQNSVTLDILRKYNIAASFVERNDANEAVLQRLGYEVWNNVPTFNSVILSAKNLESIASMEGKVVVHIDLSISENIALIKPLIEKLQARGYVFVTLSAMQK